MRSNFSFYNSRKKQKLLVSSEITGWQTYLVVAVKVMRGYLLQNFCPMRHWQSTYSIVCTFLVPLLQLQHLVYIFRYPLSFEQLPYMGQIKFELVNICSIMVLSFFFFQSVLILSFPMPGLDYYKKKC